MVTIKKIAEEAGVSTMTVSNVINKKTNKVSATTRAQIEGLLEKYNYTPNLNARSLVSSESKLIALIEYAETSNDALISFNEPFMAELLASIDNRVTSKNYFTIIRRVTNVDEITILRKNWNLAGAIVVGLNQKYFQKLMSSLNVPTVFVDSYIDRNTVDAVFKKMHRSMCFVNSDDAEGSFIATDFLLQHDRKKVGFLGYAYNAPGVVSERLEGYRQAHRDYGINVDERRIILMKKNLPAEFKKVETLARQGTINAVVVTADSVACQLIRYLKTSGQVRVPEDLQVIGFDDMYFSQWLIPSLTTIAQDTARKGKMAVDFLLKSKKTGAAQVEFLSLPVNLIQRETTAK